MCIPKKLKEVNRERPAWLRVTVGDWSSGCRDSSGKVEVDKDYLMYLMNGMLAKRFELDDGLMSLRRIFNVFTDDKLPIQINNFFVFIQIGYRYEEQGSHVVEMEVVNEEWQGVIPPFKRQVDFDVDEETLSNFPYTVVIVEECPNFRFDSEGCYEISVKVDENYIGSIPFRIKLEQSDETP